ncbi:hypothetical protein FGB62_53g05 [Gracilaria domingensis]|nr:hypothetical protein FGB62_53g05 [Gracilaria domingensis]
MRMGGACLDRFWEHLPGQSAQAQEGSFADALDAKPGQGADAYAGTFGGEGVGCSCKIPFDWQEGKQYRLRLFEIADARYPDQPEWWGAWVMDMETVQETFIGQIKVPAAWGWMKGSTNFFVEYYLSVPSCGETPFQQATLHTPTRENGRVVPTGDPSVKNYGTCADSASITVGAQEEAICKSGKEYTSEANSCEKITCSERERFEAERRHTRV